MVNEIYYTIYKSINGFKNMTRVFSHNNLQTTIRKLKFYNFKPNGANNRLYKIDIYQACCFMTCNLLNVTNNNLVQVSKNNTAASYFNCLLNIRLSGKCLYFTDTFSSTRNLYTNM